MISRLRFASLWLVPFALNFASASAAENSISHGPMLGHVSDTSIRVWARTARPGKFVVQYGTQAEKLDQSSQPVATVLEHDCAASLELTGLAPRTRYHYRVVLEGEQGGPGGSFRTLPSSEALRDEKYTPRGLYNFRF